MVLSAADIEELRELQESTFIDSCTISDPSHKTAAYGQEWTERDDPVACAVSSLAQAIATGQVVIVPDLPGDEVVRVFALPVSAAPIKQGARIDWSGEESANHYYEVRTTEEPGSYAMQLQVIAVRRRETAS